MRGDKQGDISLKEERHIAAVNGALLISVHSPLHTTHFTGRPMRWWTHPFLFIFVLFSKLMNSGLDVFFYCAGLNSSILYWLDSAGYNDTNTTGPCLSERIRREYDPIVSLYNIYVYIIFLFLFKIKKWSNCTHNRISYSRLLGRICIIVFLCCYIYFQL